MQFGDLLATVRDLPVFRSSFLLAGNRDPADVRRQLARWTRAGRVVQLRRNVYLLGQPWRRIEPHPFVVANALQRPSYVSLQSALAYHGMIPEAAPVTTSVTTGRPLTCSTALGAFTFRRLGHRAFFGYREVAVLHDQAALIATPAKALLDLVYLTPGGEAPEYLESLRLDALDAVPARDLLACARCWDKPKIRRAVAQLLRMKRGAGARAAR